MGRPPEEAAMNWDAFIQWRQRAKTAEARVLAQARVIEAARELARHPYGQIYERDFYRLREALAAGGETETP